MFAVLRTTVVESGIRSLYTGLSAALLRQMTYSMVRLSSYDRMKAWLTSRGRGSSMEFFAAAMAAGAMGGLAGNPAGMYDASSQYILYGRNAKYPETYCLCV